MGESLLFSGKLFQVVNRKEKKIVTHSNQNYTVNLNYEMIRRPPGVRAIITSNDQILLNREYRYEFNEWDYRLPGGKVFDSFIDYEKAINNNSIFDCIKNGLSREIFEETGLLAKKFELFYKSILGFTVEWDLYFYIISEFEESTKYNDNNIRKNEFEFIDHCWMDYNKVFDYCVQGKISEERSSNALMRFIINNRKRV